VHSSHVVASKHFPSVFNPLHLNFLLFIVQVVRQRTERTIPKEQVDLFERKLSRFLCDVLAIFPSKVPPPISTYLEHEPNRRQRNAQIKRHKDEVKLIRYLPQRNRRDL
jgi:hypothetical protein